MGEREKKKTSRHLAVLCLTSWDRERQAVQPYIESLIYDSAMAASDRHLAVMMVQGVLRQLQYLDSILTRFSKHPLGKMKPLTLMALRVGVYQLLFLDRVPDSAAVNETVKLLKAERQPGWLVSFANGLLRNIGRNKEKLPGADKAGKDGTPVYNHPAWLVERWIDRYGAEKTGEICFLNSQEPFLVLRVNTLLTSTERLIDLFKSAGIKACEGKYAPEAVVVESSTGGVLDMPGFAEGFFHVQDEAAQLVTLLLGPFDQGGNYLDACAGLGGKTCQLAQMASKDPKLFAVEPNEHRFALLEVNLRRLGLEKKVQSFRGRIGDFMDKGSQLFHGILVDAPCSGTGVIRRHPDIRWNRSRKDLKAYREKQLEILYQAAQLLLPGGVLVYATCSMESEENEQVIDSFLSRQQDFSLSNASSLMPDSALGLVNSAGFFSTTPVDGLDGFFAARLVKTAK